MYFGDFPDIWILQNALEVFKPHPRAAENAFGCGEILKRNHHCTDRSDLEQNQQQETRYHQKIQLIIFDNIFFIRVPRDAFGTAGTAVCALRFGMVILLSLYPGNPARMAVCRVGQG